MKPIIPFDIVLVPFPFADLRSKKKRPCLVLATVHPPKLPDHFVVAMMTSHLDRRFPHDVELANYQNEGLPKPTLVRLSKVVTVEKGIILKKLGSLSRGDQGAVKNEFSKLFEKFL